MYTFLYHMYIHVYMHMYSLCGNNFVIIAQKSIEINAFKQSTGIQIVIKLHNQSVKSSAMNSLWPDGTHQLKKQTRHNKAKN